MLEFILMFEFILMLKFILMVKPTLKRNPQSIVTVGRVKTEVIEIHILVRRPEP